MTEDIKARSTERQIGIVNLEDDRYVRITCSAGLDTECALDWVEEIIALKRRELAAITDGGVSARPAP